MLILTLYKLITFIVQNDVMNNSRLSICMVALVACLSLLSFNKQQEPKPLKVYTGSGIKVKAYDYSGLEYFLNRKSDTTYVVNFWATWCVPCVKELPAFEKLGQKYKGSKVKILLVSLDMPKLAETKLLPFIKEKQLESQVVLLRDPDANSWISKINAKWSGAIPATLIYNKKSRKFFEKSFTLEELEKELARVRSGK